jgi:ubiquitin-activating enzyme E1 C
MTSSSSRYVRILGWKENPFGGEDVPIDGDDPQHIAWIYEKAAERAAQYNIQGVTHRLTQGVVKRIIAAVASTNGVIAAICAMEAFKIATSCANPLHNYMVFNDSEGIYTYAYEANRNENCLACSRTVHTVDMKKGSKLQDLIDFLVNNASYQMKNPGMTTVVDGRNKTLYMSNVASIEEATRPNLKKTLEELGLETDSEIVVADTTTPVPLTLKLNLVE